MSKITYRGFVYKGIRYTDDDMPDELCMEALMCVVDVLGDKITETPGEQAG
ncbi:MAG TPA: hypothetical protein VN631_18525 [Negativicutes bacterium]|nr:hypothetical protein [Negativicutes bacterium]